MTDTGTPVGERPTTGGRVRLYGSDAERARAWRERQRAREPRGELVPAMLAEASLASAVDRLGALVTAQRAAVAGELDRIEEAVLVLGDPDSLTDELQAVRTETARQLAEAADQVRAANQAAKETSRRAEEAVAEAEAAGNAAFERVEQLEPELEALRQQVADTEERAALAERRMADSVTAAEAERAELRETLRAEHEAHVSVLNGDHQRAVAALRAELASLRADHDAELEAARAVAAESVAAAEHRQGDAEQLRARAEGVASELRADLDRARVELTEARAETPRAAEAAGAQVRAVLEAQHRSELEAVAGRLEGRIGRLEGELSAATARAEAARELVTSYRAQLAEQSPAPRVNRPRAAEKDAP